MVAALGPDLSGLGVVLTCGESSDAARRQVVGAALGQIVSLPFALHRAGVAGAALSAEVRIAVVD